MHGQGENKEHNGGHNHINITLNVSDLNMPIKDQWQIKKPQLCPSEKILYI